MIKVKVREKYRGLSRQGLLDEAYESMYGYPMPGITFTGGLSYGL